MDDELERNMCYVHAAEYYDNGDYSKAISECSKGISKGLEDARIYNIRAYSYIAQGEYKKARLDFDASAELDPTDSEIRDYRDALKEKGY
jgi:Flp pilus assembly protein TadD